MSTEGQGPSHSDSIFSNFFSSITTKSIAAKFHVEPSWHGGTKICSNGPGHMTKMAAMPIYGQNFFLWNQKVDDLESLNAASGTRVL